MNRVLLVLIVGFSLLIGTLIPILADEDSDSREAQQAANNINIEAENDSGRTAVVARIRNEFTVEESQINDLRAKEMGYGEIGIVLSFARQMPGGITNENIQKVMDLRLGERKSGWGDIAKQLNLDLGQVVSQAKKMANERQAVKSPDIEQLQVQELPELSAPDSRKTALSGKPGKAGSTRAPGEARGSKY